MDSSVTQSVATTIATTIATTVVDPYDTLSIFIPLDRRIDPSRANIIDIEIEPWVFKSCAVPKLERHNAHIGSVTIFHISRSPFVRQYAC